MCFRVVQWFRSWLQLGERVRVLEARVCSGVVVGRGFALVDRDGKIRGNFSLSDDDRPYFAMNGPDGKIRFHCYLLEDGSPRVYLCNADGVDRVLILGAGDSPPLTMVN